MAERTLLMHAMAWSQLLPPAAMLLTRSRVPAHRWIAAACVISVAGDLVQLSLATRGINNLWVSYLSTPVIGVAFLLALGALQPGVLGRIALKIVVPAYVVVWYGLTFYAEDLRSFSRFAYPFHALVLLGASLWTMIVRGLDGMGTSPLRTDWFWIAGGLALHSAATAALEPVLVHFMPDRVDLVVAAYQIRAAAYVVAFIAIAWGITCPRRLTRSGLSSSPQPSA